MNRRNRSHRSAYSILPRLLFTFLLAVLPLLAKTDVDFDPNADFSKYKTFAFVGGVRNLVMLPLDPDVVDERVHRAVAQGLTGKGLREVQSQNADLIVRYWVNASQQVNIANMGDWSPYSPYITSFWAPMFNSVSAASGKESCLVIDLIDPKTKTLAWRLYLTRKIAGTDKDWKKTEDEFAKGFESFPPSSNDKDAKRKERAAQSSAK
jgi:hypothetical protein